MPRSRTQTGSEPRYPKRSPERQARMVTPAGVDLGPVLKPADIYIRLRQTLHLDDDELLEAFRRGGERLAGRAQFPELTEAEEDAAIAAAAAVTRSRLDAWRRRGREMTWLELRALLIGLRETL